MTTEGKSIDEHDQLGKFVGRWNTEGKIRATNTSPEVKIIGTDTYEWLPGEYFLYQFDLQISPPDQHRDRYNADR